VLVPPQATIPELRPEALKGRDALGAHGRHGVWVVADGDDRRRLHPSGIGGKGLDRGRGGAWAPMALVEDVPPDHLLRRVQT
jgi:hypothetical protein